MIALATCHLLCVISETTGHSTLYDRPSLEIRQDEAHPTVQILADDKNLLVALLQMDPKANDQQVNLEKAKRFCVRAASHGADIALMPEMWNIGYTRFDPQAKGSKEAFWEQAVAKEGPWVQYFALLAKELNMAIAVTYEQAWDPLPRNVVTLFDRHGHEVYTYAKVHTSDFKPMERSMTPGTEFFVGDLDAVKGIVKVGSMICFDREQPESARILMLQGAEILLVPNCCGLDDMRLQQFRVRGFENLVGVAMANYPRPYMNGHSVAYDAQGQNLVLAGEEEGIYYAGFDLDRLRSIRKRSIWGNAYRRPHRYQQLVSPEKDPVWTRIDGIGENYDSTGR